MAPLFFCALALAAAGSVWASPLLWLGALGCAVIATLTAREAAPRRATVMAWAVIGFAAWLVLTNAFVNPSYTAAAPFHAAFLVTGFVLGRRLDADGGKAALGALVAFAATLAIYAFWQIAFLGSSRAQAHFETPATLAAALNLALLPLLVRIGFGGKSALLFFLAVLVAAGVVLSTSRGGWIALAAGVGFALILARRAGLSTAARAGVAIAFTVVAGGALAFLVPVAIDAVRGFLVVHPSGGSTGLAGELSRLFLGATASASSLDRLELYGLALAQWAAQPWLGIGYLGFYYALEAGRAAVPSYGADMVTYFVHNDYLQALLELGVPGATLFAAVALLPIALAWRAAPRLRTDAREATALMAAAAAGASMSVHALFDFPFFIPVCLLVYGAAAGLVDGLHSGIRAKDGEKTSLPPKLARIGSIVMSAAIAWVLLLPAAAEASAEMAQYRWRTGKLESAAYWFEVARRIERRDWRYHWYAGQFWLAQAAQNRSSAAARLADEAFAAGIEANPREVRNLVGRIDTQRVFGALLPAPASTQTLVRWSERALAVAPLNREVGALHQRVLKHASQGRAR